MLKCAFSVLCLFVLLGCAYCDDNPFMPHMKECAAAAGVTVEEMMEMAAKKDPKFGCIKACVMEKMNVLINGQIDKNALYSVVDQHKDHIPNYVQMRSSIEMCYTEAMAAGTADKCDHVAKFCWCMHGQM